MKRKRKTAQVAASVSKPEEGKTPSPEENDLTYKEARFVEEYVSHGNGALAARNAGYSISTCAQIAHENLSKLYIQMAVERERESQRKLLDFKKEDALKILVGMAGASLDDFTELFEDPSKKENYRKLGYKRFAVSSAKKRISLGEDGEPAITNEVTIISPGERRAALNELWEKLGLGNTGSEGDRPVQSGGVLTKLRARFSK